MIYKRYSAVVARVNDPSKLGRIRVYCAEILPPDQELPIWAEPSQFFMSNGAAESEGSGMFWVPRVGSRVLIEMPWADPAVESIRAETLAVAMQAWYYPTPYSSQHLLDSDFVDDAKYPEIRGFRDPAGHVIIFDATDGEPAITIRHAPKESYITLQADGTAIIHAPAVHIDAGADTHLVRGEDLKTWLDSFINNKFNTHIHPTGVGPSGAPTSPATVLPSSALSDSHMVK